MPEHPLILLIDPAQRLNAPLQSLDYRLHEWINPLADAVSQVADLHPALIITTTDAIPRWMPDVRASPATRRIPVLAVGDDMRAARHNGITDVISEAKFREALPGALAERVRIYDAADALAAQCVDQPSAEVLKGLREFNAHEYYECHETLEQAWMTESGPVRELYRAILQVGIAYYQIERGNYQGAHKMFLRTIQWFDPLPDRCQGIDVARLRADAAAARAHLEALGADRIAEFDRSLLKPIDYEGFHD